MELNEEVKKELNRCLNCPASPCKLACPFNNEIPKVISLAKENKIMEAYDLLKEKTCLSSICGIVCPHAKQCEGSCTRNKIDGPVKIGLIESSIANLVKENCNDLNNLYDTTISSEELEKNSSKNIAIVGSGPSGITCAYFLARKGYKVTIFEKHDTYGGLLTHGIPEFRLDREIIKKEYDNIINKLGIKIFFNKELEKDIFLTELLCDYDAVYLAMGANIPQKMGIEGEDFENVYQGNSLLENNNHPDYTGKIVAVSGGGDVAIDTVRTIIRKGAKKVYLIYRRARENMPCQDKEVEEAIEEGVEIKFQKNIVKILDENDNKVHKLVLIDTELVEENGKIVAKNIEGTEHELDVDVLVMAIGSKADKELNSRLDLDLNEKNYIKVNENHRTSAVTVFAGGLVANSNNTVAFAGRDGRDAAEKIIEYLNNL
jgi:glutamate synthase (NADPH/NADH) small chain